LEHPCGSPRVAGQRPKVDTQRRSRKMTVQNPVSQVAAAARRQDDVRDVIPF
jgi:hypothetical protein